MREEELCLSFSYAYINEEYLYAVNSKHNIFFRADRINNYRTEILGILDGFRHKQAGNNCAIEYYKGSLYIFSNCSYEIIRYDLESKKFFHYFSNEHKEIFDKVHAVCRIKNDVWILRDIFEKILCVFSLENNSYSFFELNISELLEHVNSKNKKQLVREKVCLVNQKIWRCISGTNYIYSIDVSTKLLRFYRIPLDIDFFAINYDGTYFYLISSFGDWVIQWDEKKGVIDKKNINYGKKVYHAFRNILCIRDMYILLPFFYDKMEILNEKKENGIKCEFPAQFRRIYDKRGLFFNYFQDNERVLLFPFAGNGLIEIDSQTLKTKYFSICISRKEYMKVQIAEYQNLIESSISSLDDYIGLLVENKFNEKVSYSNKQRIGKRIIRKVK